MKRTAAAATLTAVAVLLLPAAPASACSPSIGVLNAPGRAVAGSDVRVSGKAHVNWCPDPSDVEVVYVDPTTVPREGGPGPLPTITLPPLVPVAYARPERAKVTVTLTPLRRGERSGPARTVATVLADPAEPKGAEHTFAGTVRIPADVATGRYRLEAKQADGVSYGGRDIDVTAGLAATGGDAAAMARAALLVILAGVGALVLAPRVERRAGR